MSRRSLLLLLVMAAGCVPDSDGIVVFDERFEDCVECRWTIDGSVEQVASFHPGEHALHFVTPTTMTSPVNVTIWDDLSDGHWLEYSSNCGGAPELWVAPDGTGWHVFVEIPMFADGGPRVFERAYANLPPIPRPDFTAATISALSLIVDEPEGDRCAIDNLRLIQPAPESGY